VGLVDESTSDDRPEDETYGQEIQGFGHRDTLYFSSLIVREFAASAMAAGVRSKPKLLTSK
jgi:hypothetical protein